MFVVPSPGKTHPLSSATFIKPAKPGGSVEVMQSPVKQNAKRWAFHKD